MKLEFFNRPGGLPKLAYRYSAGSNTGLPTVMFLGGYKSDMEGTKATYLEAQCKERGQTYLRFDYSGHGSSEGKFEDGKISTWRDDARAVFEHIIGKQGPAILVGSSMGGWISLLLALEYPQRIAGLVGIAAAADFTRTIYTRELQDAQRGQLHTQGFIDIPSDYSDEPYRITKSFFDDGEKLCLLDRMHNITFPVRLVQGMKDTDVEWQTAYRIKNALKGSDTKVLLVEQGDHKLSRPEDLSLIDEQIKILSLKAK